MKKIVICIVLILCGCSKKEEFNLDYNNNVSADLVINETYSESDIVTLKNNIDSNVITYNEIQKKFRIECLRHTFQGYYLILNLDSNKRAFLFFDDALKLTSIIIKDKFLVLDDFDFIELYKTRSDKIVDFDKDTIVFPVSSVYATGHILADGYLLIFYDMVVDGVLLDSPVVKSTEFTSNEELEKKLDDFWIECAPYILPIDKR